MCFSRATKRCTPRESTRWDELRLQKDLAFRLHKDIEGVGGIPINFPRNPSLLPQFRNQPYLQPTSHDRGYDDEEKDVPISRYEYEMQHWAGERERLQDELNEWNALRSLQEKDSGNLPLSGLLSIEYYPQPAPAFQDLVQTLKDQRAYRHFQTIQLRNLTAEKRDGLTRTENAIRAIRNGQRTAHHRLEIQLAYSSARKIDAKANDVRKKLDWIGKEIFKTLDDASKLNQAILRDFFSVLRTDAEIYDQVLQDSGVSPIVVTLSAQHLVGDFAELQMWNTLTSALAIFVEDIQSLLDQCNQRRTTDKYNISTLKDLGTSFKQELWHTLGSKKQRDYDDLHLWIDFWQFAADELSSESSGNEDEEDPTKSHEQYLRAKEQAKDDLPLLKAKLDQAIQLFQSQQNSPVDISEQSGHTPILEQTSQQTSLQDPSKSSDALISRSNSHIGLSAAPNPEAPAASATSVAVSDNESSSGTGERGGPGHTTDPTIHQINATEAEHPGFQETPQRSSSSADKLNYDETLSRTKRKRTDDEFDVEGGHLLQGSSIVEELEGQSRSNKRQMAHHNVSGHVPAMNAVGIHNEDENATIPGHDEETSADTEHNPTFVAHDQEPEKHLENHQIARYPDHIVGALSVEYVEIRDTNNALHDPGSPIAVHMVRSARPARSREAATQGSAASAVEAQTQESDAVETTEAASHMNERPTMERAQDHVASTKAGNVTSEATYDSEMKDANPGAEVLSIELNNPNQFDVTTQHQICLSRPKARKVRMTADKQIAAQKPTLEAFLLQEDDQPVSSRTINRSSRKNTTTAVDAVLRRTKGGVKKNSRKSRAT